MSKLIVPIYSMRSYDTGKYSILKDGNVKLHLNRMDWDNDLLVIPNQISDLAEFINLWMIPVRQCVFIEYGINTVDTRNSFWNNNQLYLDSFNREIVTDITGYKGENKFYNNFNITKLPNLDRPYIDDFFESDIQSIRNAESTTVLNQCQKDYIVELYPELENKIQVNQQVISEKYFKNIGIEDIDFEITKDTIFFPFRLTDPCYKFQEVVEQYKDKTIVITDPNESYDNEYENVIVIKPTKKQYYGILSKKPTIIYNEDPNVIFHPGLSDFIYFGCHIICPYKVPRLNEVLIK